ncbi:hypothetical protein GA830_12215 [Mesorhizobium sp. NBSH29]|uniref:DUF6950 family protein n=1 Tax=Mesorhizobium sp. NBSH29 TaxID=2654249 RepID=UPI0018968F83|nr:hypothetical protein [Mesorhizobium sp. NBSH29]QPC87422.1 hypothetical protein GA830_12215 [Mesorhizobium sp. NBSH29]
MRYSFWRSALADYVDDVKAQPFAWGTFDCALFAAGAVNVMTGADIGADHRGKYKTLAGGLKRLKAAGFANHADYAASLFEEIHPSHAQVGDIAAIKATDAGLYALGVVQGPRILFVRQEGGLGSVDLLTAERAFKV